MTVENRTSPFIVLGAGVGGICSAIDLAEAGYPVVLVEKGPRTGGILPQLDHQYPDDHCGMCRMLPMLDRDTGEQTCLKRGLFHDNIRILTCTTLTGLSGQTGNYTAALTRVSSGIDGMRCTCCMACIDICPVTVPDAFNDRVGGRKAIYRPFFGNPGALPTIDWDSCTGCGECVKACPNDAINLERTETIEELVPVAGVIVAGGNPLYDPAATDLYGYGILPNVVTATAFERIMSGSGPFRGQPVRPSDGRPIRRVAWIQCVGSRNVMIGAGHCSSTCCLFAVKEALLAKRMLGADTAAAIFYMDMRTYGRDTQRYRDRAEEESSVRFIRCRIHSVEPADASGDLKLTYLDSRGRPVDEIFDMVVLSTGAGVQQALPPFLADQTVRGAVVAIGPEAGLQDIRETVLRAHAAVASLLEKLNPGSRATTIAKSDKAGNTAAHRFSQQPVIQVIILENPVAKTPPVDWPAVEDRLQRLAGNILVNRLSIVDGRDLPTELLTLLEGTRGNRLLVVSNAIAGYRSRLTQRFAEAGFSAALVEWVDLNRNDVMMGPEPIEAEVAAKPIQVALMRLLHKRPVRGAARVVENSALVMGAGPAGLSAAISLAEQGVAVHLVEKAATIGGNGPRIRDDHQRRPIEHLMERVKGHARIAIHTGATLGALSGRPGHLEGRIVKDNMELPVAFGAVIIATGGSPAPTAAYGLGKHPRLVSHFDFEQRIHDPRFAGNPLSTVVMIQCAGSREEPRNYCSRSCCVKALDNALQIRRLFPDAAIVVFYRDIMTYGTSEEGYARARTQRIRFVPFDKSRPPVVRAQDNSVIVDGFDPVMGEALHLEADWVSLAVGLVPAPIQDLCHKLDVPLTRDGFVQEADAKWRPVDTINSGVFVCGLAKGPVRADEAVVEGKSAALRALRLLNRTELTPQRHSAVVRHAICSRCRLCVDACPYGARFVEAVLGRLEVDPAACQGCGTCAAVCPNSATVMGDNEDFTVMSIIEAALE